MRTKNKNMEQLKVTTKKKSGQFFKEYKHFIYLFYKIM